MSITDKEIEILNEYIKHEIECRYEHDNALQLFKTMEKLIANYQASKTYKRITVQQLMDSGLNPFAVKLLAEPFEKIELKKSIRFRFKGIGITIEPLLSPPTTEGSE